MDKLKDITIEKRPNTEWKLGFDFGGEHTFYLWFHSDMGLLDIVRTVLKFIKEATGYLTEK
jgi:heme exporter protein D